MQYCVPRKKYQKGKKIGFVLIIILFIAVVLFISFFGFYLNSKENQVFKEKTYYYVCAMKTKGTKELENIKDDVKKVGGAGKIYKKENYNYLILNVYNDESLAKDVFEKNKINYPNAVTFELKRKSISKKVKKQIKGDEFLFRYIKNHNKYMENVFALSLKYLSGALSENKFCSEILNLKFKLDEINDEMLKLESNKLNDLVKNQVNLELYYYSAFFDNFFKNDKKDSIVCEFVVNLTILSVEFFNNL